MLALKIVVFLLTLGLGLVASGLSRIVVPEQPNSTFEHSTPMATQPITQRPSLKRQNCVDATGSPKLREHRLKEMDRLLKKVESLGRDLEKSNSLKRNAEILNEAMKVERQLRELDHSSDAYPKAVYREICYE